MSIGATLAVDQLPLGLERVVVAREDDLEGSLDGSLRGLRRSGRGAELALEGDARKGGLSLRDLATGDVLGTVDAELVEAFDERLGLPAIRGAELPDPSGVGRRLGLFLRLGLRVRFGRGLTTASLLRSRPP